MYPWLAESIFARGSSISKDSSLLLSVWGCPWKWKRSVSWVEFIQCCLRSKPMGMYSQSCPASLYLLLINPHRCIASTVIKSVFATFKKCKCYSLMTKSINSRLTVQEHRSHTNVASCCFSAFKVDRYHVTASLILLLVCRSSDISIHLC